MKKFLYKTGLCLGIILLMVVVAEIVSPHFIHNNNTFKKEYMDNHADEIEILLLGDSHIEVSFDPYQFSGRTFSLATAGRDILCNTILAEMYVPQMKKLHTVIFTLNPNLIQGRRHKRKDNAARLISDHAKVFGITEYPFPRNLTCRSLLLMEVLRYNTFNQEISVDSAGYEKHTEEYRSTSKEGFLSQMRIPSEKDKEQFVEMLQRTAEVCSVNNVRLIYIVCPHTDIYLQRYPAELFEELHRLVDQAKENHTFEFHDYSADPDFRSLELYINDNHLGHIGAKAFAQRVAKDFGL